MAWQEPCAGIIFDKPPLRSHADGNAIGIFNAYLSLTLYKILPCVREETLLKSAGRGVTTTPARTEDEGADRRANLPQRFVSPQPCVEPRSGWPRPPIRALSVRADQL